MEYFRLMLPPWDEERGLHNWKQVKVRSKHALHAATSSAQPPTIVLKVQEMMM